MLIDKYVKELYNSTQLTPVVLPGSSIELGDIIKFRKKTMFGNPKIGNFINISSLYDLSVPFSTKTAATISNRTYTSSSGINSKVAGEIDNIVEAEISFARKGLVYLNAIGVKEYTITNYNKLKERLRLIVDHSLNDCFVVTKLICADHAVIMQSNEANGKLNFKTKTDPSLGVSLEAGAYEKHSYHNVLQNNVTLFVDLIKIKTSEKDKTREEVITGININNPRVKQLSGKQLVEGNVVKLLTDEKITKFQERKNKKMFFKVNKSNYEE